MTNRRNIAPVRMAVQLAVLAAILMVWALQH